MSCLWTGIDSLSVRQRVVIVVAVGIALAVVVCTVNFLLVDGRTNGAWFAYAPNTGTVYRRHRSFRETIGPGLVRLAAVAAWAAFGIRALRVAAPERD